MQSLLLLKRQEHVVLPYISTRDGEIGEGEGRKRERERERE